MAPSKLSRANPLAFTRWPVTVITAAVYIAFVVPLLVIHHVVPPAPSNTTPSSFPGLNLTEAWSDLQLLTNGFRPYNSHKNDHVRQWLLKRIHEIVDSPSSSDDDAVGEEGEKPAVFVFDDMQSNLTFSGISNGYTSVGVYFEGSNIMVYVRGTDDDMDHWWEDKDGEPSARNKGGVLVNAHYDSVSTGYGATDDGVGVVTCLQLLKYFTRADHAPRRGLVILFNNGEEDFLNGARVYSQHPISKLAHTFLNLEGAGAGGRATLFRSSDTEVTRPYGSSAHPFGSVLSANGFETGLIRSQTDYVVFQGDMGLRGLDVAFMAPRARYHTDQDDARHTSPDSMWHMLSAAVATTENLVSDESAQFDGRPRDDGKVPSGTGSKAVWFDLFGSTFVVFQLHTLFALSVTLLIVAPLALLVTSIALVDVDRMYLFRSKAYSDGGASTGGRSVSLGGVRGFFRFPFLFGIPTAVTVGLAYLITKVNPYIVHSSPYAVWGMMVPTWIFLAWFVSRVADFARPSAFHRVYTLSWLFALTWALLVIATVYENQWGLAGGYFIFFYFAGVFLATWISYLELFFLPRKSEYASRFNTQPGLSRQPSAHGSRLGTASGRESAVQGEDEEEGGNAEEEPTESTSLLRGGGQRTTFANYTRVTGDRHRYDGNEEEEEKDPNIYGQEQGWSAHLPKWTWVLQFFLIAPIVLIILGPLALLLTTALYQTGEDGGSVLFVYISIAGLTTVLFSPLLPFIHRYTYHVPVLLLFVFVGTLIYNLSAFPFSESNRLKLSFLQEVNLDTGVNRASLTGISPFVTDVINSLPSAAGKYVSCEPFAERVKCSWEGLPPHTTIPSTSLTGDDGDSKDWISFNITKPDENQRKAQFQISGKNTRACKIVFNENTPVPNFHVAGSAYDELRFPHTTPGPDRNGKGGTREIRLWSRRWENTWTVDVDLPDISTDEESKVLSGKVICLWSDQNQVGLIPALDEVRQYAPDWAGVSKLSDGLVEGGKGFEVEID